MSKNKNVDCVHLIKSDYYCLKCGALYYKGVNNILFNLYF